MLSSFLPILAGRCILALNAFTVGPCRYELRLERLMLDASSRRDRVRLRLSFARLELALLAFGHIVEDAQNRGVSFSWGELGRSRFHGESGSAVRSDHYELDVSTRSVATGIPDQAAHRISMFLGYVGVYRGADDCSPGCAPERGQPGVVDVEDPAVTREPHEVRQPVLAGLQECWQRGSHFLRRNDVAWRGGSELR